MAWWRKITSGSWIAPLVASIGTGLLAVFLLFRRQLRDLFDHRAGVKRLKDGSANVSDATRLYERALLLLEKRGLQRPPWLTPVEFARVLPAGDTALLFEDLTATYNEIRFGGRLDAAPRLVRLMERLESLLKAVE